MAATDRPAPQHWAGAQPPAEIAAEPVVLVTFLDAQAYCAWAGQRRLPTVAEWQNACRSQQLEYVGSVWEWTATQPAEAGGADMRVLCGPGSTCDCSHRYHVTWKNAVKGFRCASTTPVATVPVNSPHELAMSLETPGRVSTPTP